MIVPEQVKRSGTSPQPIFFAITMPYVLGIIGQRRAKDPDYSPKRFEAFRQHNVELLSKTDSDAARAVIAFLQQHDPHTARQNARLSPANWKICWRAAI